MSSTSKEPKETKDSAGTKERKRTKKVVKTENVSRSSSPESKKSRNISTDTAKQNARAIFFHEENSVDKRNPLDDLKKHSQVCDEFRNILASIKALKEKGSSEKNAAKLEELRVKGTLLFVDLRKLNRMSHFRCKKVRDQTHERKQQIDHQHLQLQNLLYEVMHLQKEITKCLQFKSNDEDVNLVTVEDFYKDAPPEISKPDVTKKDLHQQTLARLDWELTQRKRLSEMFKERQKVKDEIKGEIQIKDDFLDSLQPKLNTILQATKPVQDYLGMPFDEIREQHRSATYLPRPLYVLFMQASAYRDACDKNLQVAIEGEVEEAKSLDSTTFDLGKADEDSDSEAEDQEKEGTKKRRRRTTETKTTKDSKLFKRHPLNVVIDIKCKDGGSVIRLTFHYMLVLEIVTLTLKVEKGTEKTPKTQTGGDLVSTESILNYLYPDDLGTDTPNPSNKYALQKFGLGQLQSYISEIGRPYQWVQWLCGLQFLAAASESNQSQSAQPAVSATHMEDTIKRIRRRLKARISLQQQLASFEKLSIPVSADCMSLFPAKITARLASWDRSYYDDFAAAPHCQSIIQADLARETDMYFVAVVERGSAKMTSHIVLPSEYPVCPPVFAVSIMWKTERNNTNDPNIRDLEAEINIHYTDLLKDKCNYDQLLTNQLQRLLVCFDVYLETENDQAGQEQGPLEFGKEKIFPRTSKGPARGKPYVFNAELGFFGQR